MGGKGAPAAGLRSPSSAPLTPRSLRGGQQPLRTRTLPPPSPHTHSHTLSHTHTHARGGGGSPAGAFRACAMSAPGRLLPCARASPTAGRAPPPQSPPLTGAGGERGVPLRAAQSARSLSPFAGALGSPGEFVRSGANRCPALLANPHEGRSWRCWKRFLWRLLSRLEVDSQRKKKQPLVLTQKFTRLRAMRHTASL